MAIHAWRPPHGRLPTVPCLCGAIGGRHHAYRADARAAQLRSCAQLRAQVACTSCVHKPTQRNSVRSAHRNFTSLSPSSGFVLTQHCPPPPSWKLESQSSSMSAGKASRALTRTMSPTCRRWKGWRDLQAGWRQAGRGVQGGGRGENEGSSVLSGACPGWANVTAACQGPGSSKRSKAGREGRGARRRARRAEDSK